MVVIIMVRLRKMSSSENKKWQLHVVWIKSGVFAFIIWIENKHLWACY